MRTLKPATDPFPVSETVPFPGLPAAVPCAGRGFLVSRGDPPAAGFSGAVSCLSAEKSGRASALPLRSPVLPFHRSLLQLFLRALRKFPRVLPSETVFLQVCFRLFLSQYLCVRCDGADIIQSRIGLRQKAHVIYPDTDIIAEYHRCGDCDVIISDESQFLTPSQIDDLRTLVDEENLPVLCFGLRTDFLTHFFPGAMRLMELADSITEIKTICECGRKATVNARFDENGRIITEGDQVMLGGNDRYTAMCHKCWISKIKEQNSQKQTDERLHSSNRSF